MLTEPDQEKQFRANNSSPQFQGGYISSRLLQESAFHVVIRRDCCVRHFHTDSTKLRMRLGCCHRCCHRCCHSCYSLVREAKSPRSTDIDKLRHHLHTSTHIDAQRITLMAPNILLTGVSGYLGGTLLNEWKTSGPKNHGTMSVLVRNDEQAKEVAKYGVPPLIVSLKDEELTCDRLPAQSSSQTLQVVPRTVRSTTMILTFTIFRASS